MKKITIKISNTVKETFEDFIISRKAKGLSDKTLTTYNQHFKAIQRHIDVDIPIDDLTKTDLESMVSSMREAELAPNTISSYVRTMKTFLSWCNDEEITSLKMQNYKSEETIKETYTDKELERLLKKPNMRQCAFAEYRTWVIINLLVNNGTRAATIRNIKNKDVDLENLVIYLRHTKSKKSQVIPLCTELSGILKEYLRIRGGSDDDFLFPTENGEQLKEHGLRSSVARYNNRRGIQKTSIHAFRHTFARKYLVDCGGNAFTLQRLLGHSTLDMTKHYCAIYKLGFSPYDVKYVIHSHGHYDHLGGTKAFCELTGAKTFIGERDVTYADGREDLTWAKDLGYAGYFEAFTPDVLMHDGDVIDLGNTEIEVISTPGHTPGTMSFFFDIEEDGNTYHVAMHGGVGINSLTLDFLDKYNLPYSLREEFIKGIDKVIDRDVDIFIGNHVWNNKTDERYQKLIAGDKDAFVDKEQWKNFLNGVKKEFTDLVEKGI